MIEEGKITTNGQHFTKNKKIYRGDIIEIRWTVENMALEAEDMELDIVFENADFAIINKDAGINTHPTPGEEGRKGTLVNALLYHFKNLGMRSDGDFCHPVLIAGSSEENDSGFLLSQE